MVEGEGREVPRLASAADWAAVVWGIVVRPLETLTGLAETRAWRKAIAFSMVNTLAGSLVSLTQPPQEEARSAFFRVLGEPLIRFGVFPLLDAVALVLFTGLLYQIGLRQGGTGPYSRYLTTDGFQTSTVGLVTLPITLVGNLIQRALDQGMPWLDYILGFPTAVWGIALAVISLRAGMRLSTRGAIVTILIAVAIGAVIIGLLTCVAVGFVLAGQVRQSPEMEPEGWLAVVFAVRQGLCDSCARW